MSNVTEYKEISAIHPGYYIADIIEDMGVTQAEFAKRMGTNTKTLSYLINGQANITNDLAKKLSVMMGTSADVWLNLQNTYDQKIIEIQMEKDFEEQAVWARMLDYQFFICQAGLPPVKTIKEKVYNLCSFFHVSDLRNMLEPDFLVHYRTGIARANEKNIISSRAWLQTAINFSKNIETRPYNAKKLKEYLPELRSMTLQSPEQFLPRMREIFSDCGVAFVLLPSLKNSGVNGAVKWVSEDRAVLAMNNRRLDADIFWFSLFHEIRHVLQKKTKTTFISYSEQEMVEMNKQLEDDADRFAMNYLISEEELDRFSPSRYSSDEEIIVFAETIGIHPGIVAGRLQHDGILPANRCSKLKVKYDFFADFLP